MGPGGEGWGPAFLFVSLYIHLHPDPVSGNRGRHLRTPPTQPGGSAAGAGLRRTAGPASVRGSLCGLRTRTRRGGDDGGARRVETRWRGVARRDNGAIVASPGSGCRPTSPCNAPTLPCYRARRGGVGDVGGIEPACTDAPDGARPRGERKDALDTVALRRCRAQVASIAAAAAASVGVKPQAEAPHSAPVAPRNALRRRLRRRTCTARARTQRHRFVLQARAGQSLRVRAQLLRSARASRRAAKGARRSMANVEMVGSSAVRRRAWSRSQRGAEARIAQRQKGSTQDGRIKGGPSQYPERLLRSPFSGSPGFVMTNFLTSRARTLSRRARPRLRSAAADPACLHR
jgi:hypothetical protein